MITSNTPSTPSVPAAQSPALLRLRELVAAAQRGEGACTAAEMAAMLRGLAADLDAAPTSTTPLPEVALLERCLAAPAHQEDEAPVTKRRKQGPREFDFCKYRTRFVALELMYLGGTFQGFARQADSANTIEGHMFAALLRTKLVPEDWDPSTLCYSRCGRTDKGVSALGQVVALRLRSLAHVEDPDLPPEREMDYCSIINRVLPDGIRVLGWTPAPEGFSARFDAQHREYLYFLVEGGGLDIPAMNAAAASLVGTHDFRNFCKADVVNVHNYVRTVTSAGIELVQGGAQAGERRLYALRIRGTAFLYHQVRCIMAVLFLVGRGLEQPSIVERLLDVQATPSKPQYTLAPEAPLLLNACGFSALPPWRRSVKAQRASEAVLVGEVDGHLIAAALAGTMLQRLQADASSAVDADGLDAQQGSGAQGRGPYTPLLKRAREPSLHERFVKAGLDPALINRPGGLRDQV